MYIYNFLILVSTKQTMACLLQQATSGTTTQGGNKRKRRKRQTGDSAATKRPSEELASTQRPTTTHTVAPKTKYGCPVGFSRGTEYVCLHYRNDANGTGVPSTFDASQKYCQDQIKGASLLYFTNYDSEALKIWKWLGNVLIYF